MFSAGSIVLVERGGFRKIPVLCLSQFNKKIRYGFKIEDVIVSNDYGTIVFVLIDQDNRRRVIIVSDNFSLNTILSTEQERKGFLKRFE